jgi:hypothetical protein
MGTQWHFIYHKALLKVVVVAWQKCYCYVYQKKGHRVYTIRNSMELYPSQRLSIRSIATW